MSTNAVLSQLPLSSELCPSCSAPVLSKEDKFCRTCGLRIRMVCGKSGLNVRPADKFCTHCGSRRYTWFEMWRHGTLHRHPGFVLGTTIVVGLSYAALYVWIKSRRR